MNRPNFPSMPPREPSKQLSIVDDELVFGNNAGDFIAALGRIKARHPDATDEAISMYSYDGDITLSITTTKPNDNFESDMAKFKENLESSRKEYAAYLEAYKTAPST
jgi:hypothetical protein